MWPPKVDLEELKTIVRDAVTVRDSMDYWMISWIDKFFLSADGSSFFRASIHRVMTSELNNLDLSSLDLNNPRFVSLPLRLMRIFPVGTLIRDGVVFFKSHNHYIPRFDLRIDTSKDFEHTTLGKWKHGNSLIKKMYWHKIRSGYSKEIDQRLAANSKVLVFNHTKSQLSNFEYILIPAAELARFYWFPSTKLFRALMNGKAASRDMKNELYVPEETGLRSKDGIEFHQIILRDEMHLLDARPIARLAFDSNALYSANMLYKSVIDTKLEAGNNGALYIDCVFPFKEFTRLKVMGFIAEIDQTSVLIVSEIMKSDPHFPFDVLGYDHETKRKKIDESLEKEGWKTVPKDEGKPKPKHDEPDEEEEEEDELENYYLSRFGFLTPNPSQDNTQKNDSSARPALYNDKGSRYTSVPKAFRLERYDVVGPKNEREGKWNPYPNLSTNDNTKSGENSLPPDITSEEEEKEEKEDKIRNLPEHISKVAKRFTTQGGSVDFVRLVDGSKDWLQKHPIVLTIPITSKKAVSLYMMYVRIMKTEFMLCWMDLSLRTAVKIITKNILTAKGKAENPSDQADQRDSDNEKAEINFEPSDASLIAAAIKSGYTNFNDLNSSLKADRIYNLKKTTSKNDYRRIMELVKFLYFKD